MAPPLFSEKAMRKLPLFVLLLAAAVPAFAQQVSVRDFATVNMRGSKPSVEEKNRAEQDAKRKAWNKYQANAPESRQSFYMTNAAIFLEQLDTLCNITFYDPVVDASAKTYTVKVNMACNENQISALVTRLGGGGAGAQSTAASGDKPQISLAFFVRRAEERTQFIDKKKTSNSATVETSGSDVSGDIAEDSSSSSLAGSSNGASVTQTQTTESKGTISSRDDQFKYTWDPADSVKTAVNQVLTTKGFDVVEYDDVAGSCEGPTTEEVIESASDKGNIPGQTRNKMRNAARACEVGFFGIGILEVTSQEKLVDGSLRVGVRILLDVDRAPPPGSKNRFFGKAASINVDSTAQDSDRSRAQNKALKEAAERGVRELTEILLTNQVN